MTFFLLSLVAVITAGDRTSSPAVTKLIPFELDRNKVIIPTNVNGSEELRLILDSGMRFDGVYLFHEELLSLIDTTGAIEVRVPGAGGGEASTATMIENGRLEFGDLQVDSQRVIVARSPHTQTFPTDGVIGWNLFGHYIVEIDYDAQLITLHDTSGIELDTSWTIVPITLREGLPFFDCEVEVVAGEVVPITVYIDLASGDALEMLTKPTQKYSLPDSLERKYLGTGLSGDIYGSFGRSRRLQLAGYDLLDVPTAFAPVTVRSKQKGADGILGNNAIRRFNIIFDYPHDRICLKPNQFTLAPFEH